MPLWGADSGDDGLQSSISCGSHEAAQNEVAVSFQKKMHLSEKGISSVPVGKAAHSDLTRPHD